MKQILVLMLLALGLFANVVKSEIISVDKEKNTAVIKIDNIQAGMSGFVTHDLGDGHSIILNNAVVKSFDAASKTAVLQLSEFNFLRNNSLPNGTWEVKAGDTAVLAFGYSRAFLVAPDEEIYYRITKSMNSVQWIHPDIFASILSFNGHPTPLKSDFIQMSKMVSVGLLFIYLDKKVYTLDCRSFKILNITDAPLEQTKAKLPFYSRVEQIDANWFGEGSSTMQEYAPHYYELMAKNNKNNKELFHIIKDINQTKYADILKEFESEEK